MDAKRSFAVVLEPDAHGGYTAIAPALPGVVSEGETVEEALDNVRDAIRLCLEDLAAQGEAIPESDFGTKLERVEVPLAG
ncbi:MAG TPA: type II toxin-antitoxin system HicB family antitoxin [Candidatus Cybelea sp.]|nr:type II toxin-antitoxin system HicB family antitoxin [Candidatus Cybelea sp.]